VVWAAAHGRYLCTVFLVVLVVQGMKQLELAVESLSCCSDPKHDHSSPPFSRLRLLPATSSHSSVIILSSAPRRRDLTPSAAYALLSRTGPSPPCPCPCPSFLSTAPDSACDHRPSLQRIPSLILRLLGPRSCDYRPSIAPATFRILEPHRRLATSAKK
jgi:hypothetical protein